LAILQKFYPEWLRSPCLYVSHPRPCPCLAAVIYPLHRGRAPAQLHLHPQRDSFYWELHESDQPIQAARFGKWKAVRNGTDKPIEIYDLETDAGESNNLAESRAELVAQAEKIFTASHQPDPHWPLEQLSEELNKSRKEAWKITTERINSRWAPENAKPIR
jgi:hypothetical protein